ncbi:hypothetical protein DID88_001089 [Monilinia fructigena]|uniref:Uncharacterized protein n=1 Tax=Monilinia fructigena TaxID=38457 RepID=A0A395J1E9_9HELO|nr:hypothetical protein DID88_001089 [Monilinia fructigena]
MVKKLWFEKTNKVKKIKNLKVLMENGEPSKGDKATPCTRKYAEEGVAETDGDSSSNPETSLDKNKSDKNLLVQKKSTWGQGHQGYGKEAY